MELGVLSGRMTTLVYAVQRMIRAFLLSSIFKSLAPKTNVVKLDFFGIEIPGEKERS